MIVKINIDGNDYEVKEGDILLNILHNLEIFIPHLCHLKGAASSGKCGLCVIEIDNDKVALSCLTNAKDGMIIKTNTKKIIEIRKNNINKILKNHNIDCFNCSKSGVCKLQEHTLNIYANCQIVDNFSSIKKEPQNLLIIRYDLIYDKTKCMHCLRCVKFLNIVCGEAEKNIELFGDLAESVDMMLNIVDICPTAALKEKSSLETDQDFPSEISQTYCITNVFTPKISVHYHDNKLIKISSLNSFWIKDEERFLNKSINDRTDDESQYKNTIKNITSNINDASLEKKVFLIGNSIDIVTFYYIKYLSEKNSNVCISINNCNIFSKSQFDIGLFNTDLSSMDFAIFVGDKSTSDRWQISSFSLNLKGAISLNINELSKFLERGEVHFYNNPYLFIYSDIFDQYEDEFIENEISNFKNNYQEKFEVDIKIKIIPRNLSQIFLKEVPEYISSWRLEKEFNKHDVKFICIVGDVVNNLHFGDIPVIYNGVFRKEKAINIPAKHFLEDECFYLNIFGKLVKTKKILHSHFKSNREFVFDIAKTVFGSDFYDVSNEIHQKIRDKYFN